MCGDDARGRYYSPVIPLVILTKSGSIAQNTAPRSFEPYMQHIANLDCVNKSTEAIWTRWPRPVALKAFKDRYICASGRYSIVEIRVA